MYHNYVPDYITGVCIIKPQKYPHLVLICVLVSVVFLAACRRIEETGPQFVTATPTPRSTPLPAVATVIPPGETSNPIKMVVRPPGSAVSRSLLTENQISRFTENLVDQSGLTVEVVVVERHAEALAALCDSSPAQITVAWLDGLSYAAAEAKNCGEPVLQVAKSGEAGAAGYLVVSSRASFGSVASLNGQDFCRVSATDYYSWLIPGLLLKEAGLDPVSSFSSVTDYEDIVSLMTAVAEGDCDFAGISADEFDKLTRSVQEDLRILAETPALPYGVLVYPIGLPLDRRLALADGLVQLALNRELSVTMAPFLGQDSLVRVESRDDFEDLADFLNDTGLDFAQLGN